MINRVKPFSMARNERLGLPNPKKSAGDTLKEGLEDAFKVGLQVVQTAAPIAMNIAGGGGGMGMLNGGVLGSAGGFGGVDGVGRMEQLLEKQMQVQLASQTFQSVSNTSKAEHDARMAAVRNMRP